MALEFLSPLHKASRQISVYLERRTQELGVSPIEGHVLTYLRSYAPASIRDLTETYEAVGSVERTLVARRSNGGAGWTLLINDGKPKFEVNYARTDAIGKATLALGTWYHIAGTYDGSTLRVYLNGQLYDQKTTGGAIPNGAGAIWIGGEYDPSAASNK